MMQHSSDDMTYLHDPTALPHLVLECDEQAPACHIEISRCKTSRKSEDGSCHASCHSSCKTRRCSAPQYEHHGTAYMKIRMRAAINADHFTMYANKLASCGTDVSFHRG